MSCLDFLNLFLFGLDYFYISIYIYMHRSIPFDKLKVGALILCDVAPACLKVTNSSDKWPWQTSHSQELCPLANCL